MVTKYQDDLRLADDRVKRRHARIHEVEKVRTHVQAERDRARADLAKAQEASHKLKQALLMVV